MVDWVEKTDIDGFNLASVVVPGTYADPVDLAVPELPRRGVYKTAYKPGTLRETLFGHARIEARHPGAAFRHWEH
jgi:hypothetical protein